jgi:hypothetical protein
VHFISENLSSCCDLQSDDEREMCARTIYCTNIDKKVCYPAIIPCLYVCLSVNVSVLIDEHNAGHSGRSEIVF